MSSKATTPCVVPECAAMATGAGGPCALHLQARTAKELHIADDVEGHGGRSCISCGRKFKADEFVFRQPRKKQQRGRPGEPYGYQHVACEQPSPKLSKKKMREAVKPLLEVCEEPAMSKTSEPPEPPAPPTS